MNVSAESVCVCRIVLFFENYTTDSLLIEFGKDLCLEKSYVAFNELVASCAAACDQSSLLAWGAEAEMHDVRHG